MPFVHGNWLVICDRCKFKRYSHQVTKTWEGHIVCRPEVKQGCFEHRHPQDFVRTVRDDSSIEFSRARPTDTFTAMSVNCTAQEFVNVPVSDLINGGTRYINKGMSVSPVNIIATTVIVNCEWRII